VHGWLKDKIHIKFERKAWYYSGKFRSAWVWACPKEHTNLNARQFVVVAQTYFGFRQECLRGLEGHTIQQKAGGGKDDTISEYDPLGENLFKATLPRSRWTYHHDEINNHGHNIIR